MASYVSFRAFGHATIKSNPNIVVYIASTQYMILNANRDDAHNSDLMRLYNCGFRYTYTGTTPE